MIEVPSYYIVNRNLPEARIADAVRSLSTTPPSCAIVSTAIDARLAFAITQEVLRVNNDPDAIKLAENLSRETERPVLVLGDVEFMDAVYADGHVEKVAC